MKPKTVMLLAVAVGSGLLAMLGVQQAMSGGGAKAEETVEVLVALQDIDVGVELTDQNVEFRAMPISVLPQDPIFKKEQYEKRSLTYAIRQDDVIRAGTLTKQGVFGKSTQVPPGMRAVAIEVDDAQTLSGLLSAGDFVDVLVTYSARDKGGRAIMKTTPLLECVKVFATDNQTAREARDASGETKSKTRIVSLLVTPTQANFVVLAKAKGKLQLIWRNVGDDTLVNNGAINEELLEELNGPERDPWGNTSSSMYKTQVATSDFPGRSTDAATDGAPPRGLDSLLNESETATAPATRPTTVAVATAEPAAPAKPKWSIQIYAGQDLRTEEFEIELSEPPADVKDLAAPPGTDAVMEQLKKTPGTEVWDLLKQAL